MGCVCVWARLLPMHAHTHTDTHRATVYVRFSCVALFSASINLLFECMERQTVFALEPSRAEQGTGSQPATSMMIPNYNNERTLRAMAVFRLRCCHLCDEMPRIHNDKFNFQSSFNLNLYRFLFFICVFSRAASIPFCSWMFICFFASSLPLSLSHSPFARQFRTNSICQINYNYMVNWSVGSRS